MTGTFIFKVAAYFGGFYLLLNLFAWWVSDKLIFIPQAPSYSSFPNEIKLQSGNGESITAVYREHPEAEFTLLFSHGNAEDLGNVVPFMERFHELGFSVLMYDYRGYGTSDGTPSVKKAKQDVAAAYRWLVQEKQIAPKTIIAHGRSLGGGLATWLAANYDVGALMIESTFVSTFRVKTTQPLLPWDKLNNLRTIAKIEVPVFVLHGTDDEIIPFWHGQKLYAAAPGKKMCLWIKGAQHNDYVYTAGDRYLDSFKTFVELIEEQHQYGGESMPK